jgi:hypothetical protein
MQLHQQKQHFEQGSIGLQVLQRLLTNLYMIMKIVPIQLVV